MRRLAIRLLLAIAPIAAPAIAQDAGTDMAPTAACQAAGGGVACAGLAAQRCDAAAMTACLRSEAAWWEAARVAAQGDALQEMQGRDSATWENPPPSLAEGLREMERAWLAYRDARCGLEQSRWWEHPDAEAYWLVCRMQVTAAEVGVLQTLLAVP